MKLKKVILLTATLISCQLKAQSFSNIPSLKSSGHWNFSYSIGIGKDLKTNRYLNTFSNGSTFSFGASNTPEKNIGFFANYSTTDLNGTIKDNNGSSSEREYNFSELSAGPRLYINDKIFFIDAGLGYYNIADDQFIGFNAGAGAKIKITDSYGVLINGRIHNTFVQGNDFHSRGGKRKAFVYYGIYFGLELNNQNIKKVSEDRKNKFAIAALGGKINSDIYYTDASTTLGAELSYGISNKIFVLFDYMYSYSEMSSSGIDNNVAYNSRSYNSGNYFSAGFRFYLTGNDFKVFTENSANMYFSHRSSEYSNPNYSGEYYTTRPYFGLNLGAGVDCKLVDGISGIFKMIVGTYFTSGSYYSGILGGLKYGF